MTTEEENELTRLRRENEDLKLLHEANLLMIDMAKERFGIDIKNYEEMLSGGCLKEVPGGKGQRRVALLCGHFGYSKQAYYRGQRAGDKLERGVLPSSLVRDIRGDMPNLGGVKLWKKLNSSGVQVGRDEFYRLPMRHDLMVKHEKRRVVTTDSSRVVPAVPKPGERAGDQAPQPGLGQ